MTLFSQAMLVGGAGFAGAIARWGVMVLTPRWLSNWPALATLVINVTGSFALGILMGFIAGKGGTGTQALRLAIGVGFLGSFTTFSTFAYETYAMFSVGQMFRAMLNITLSLALGLAAVRLGLALAR